MNHTITPQQLQHLAIAMIGIAKAELNEQDFQQLSIPGIQQFVRLYTEAVPVNHLGDATLLRHGLYQLHEGKSAEEAVMHVFTLSIYRLSAEGSNHPLERGIIRQKIIGILPIFENAVNQALITLENYDRNADALAKIAEQSPETPDILAALSAEYARLKR
jgi:hypothetical protein